MTWYWVAWRNYRNDYDHEETTYTRFGSEEEAVEYLVSQATDYMTPFLEARIRKEKRYFQWEWKRRGSHYAGYVVEGEETSFTDSLALHPSRFEHYFDGWMESGEDD